jgi:malonyl-CoA O-methyltransferase
MPIQIAPLPAYSLWAKTWESDPSAIVALESRWIAPWLSNLNGQVVVDLSCGSGRWLTHAQRQGATVFGTDLCPEMLLQAWQKPGLAGRLALADTRRLPLASGCADLTLCALSLGHLSPMESALAEMARIVRPGGSLIVTDFYPAALVRGWKRTFRNNGQLYEIETYPYTKERLIDCARENGLALQELLEPGFDEPERPIFVRAGKPELFEQVRGIPAVLLARWKRP